MPPHRACAGFTILELAVALFLLALLFGSVFVPLEVQVDTRKIEQTGQLLDRAREALLGFAATHGYFPCPADAASSGQEAAGSEHATGVCPTYHGFLPAAALGLPVPDANGYARDAWGTAANRMRYAVTSQRVGAPDNTNTFTRVNGMRAAGISNLGDAALSLFSCVRQRQRRERRFELRLRPDARIERARHDLVGRAERRDGRRQRRRSAEPQPERRQLRSHFREPPALERRGQRVRRHRGVDPHDHPHWAHGGGGSVAVAGVAESACIVGPLPTAEAASCNLKLL